MSGFAMILIVAGVVFLAMLGKHGWNPFMRVLLVLAVVPVVLVFVAQTTRDHRAPIRQAVPAVAVEGDGFVMLEQTGEVELAGPDGRFTKVPIHSQMLVPDPTLGVLDIQAQVRPPARGRVSVLFILLVVGAVGFFVALQVSRGSWSWPVVMKVGAIAAGISLLLMIGSSWVTREQSRNQMQLEARRAATEIEMVRREAPGMQPLPAPETAPEAGRFGDVEVWRRESVLGFVPSSAKQMPDWCREGLETEPEIVRVQDTGFVSPLPEGRDWIAGYSSQNPDLRAAEAEATAAARRKLGLAALLQVKKAVPELDVRPLEDLAGRLAKRESPGRPRFKYFETATLEHQRRPYGTVYRMAVRIAADPPTIDGLARRICQHVDRFGTNPQPDLQVAFFSAMLLVVLAFSAFLVYVFIRAGAAGRWVHPLRVVSGGMLVALVVAVIYVSRNLGAS